MTEQERLSAAYEDLKDKYMDLKGRHRSSQDGNAQLRIEMNRLKELNDKYLKRIDTLQTAVVDLQSGKEILVNGVSYITSKKNKQLKDDFLAVCERNRLATLEIEHLKSKL